MTQIESEAEMRLALARRAMAPSAADRARVRLALRSSLATPSPEVTAEVTVPKLGFAKIWTTRALVTALMAGVGAVGYWSGYRAGREAGRAQGPQPAAHSPLNAARVANASASAAPTVDDAPPVAPVHAIGAARRAESSAPPAVPGVPIDEELRALRRAEHALRQQNPRLALVLLEDLNRTTRGGRLLEERAAELCIARCALEPSEATRLRLEFEQSHASSVYLNRVKHSCESE